MKKHLLKVVVVLLVFPFVLIACGDGDETDQRDVQCAAACLWTLGAFHVVDAETNEPIGLPGSAILSIASTGDVIHAEAQTSIDPYFPEAHNTLALENFIGGVVDLRIQIHVDGYEALDEQVEVGLRRNEICGAVCGATDARFTLAMVPSSE